MPQGFSTFSLNLFGFLTRNEPEGACQIPDDQQETVGMTETNERADRPATDAEEVAFWGLGLFPVL